MGQDEECVFAKMEAIYQYYKNNIDSQFDKKVEETFVDGTLNCKSISGIIHILRCIEYQLVAEKEGRTPFIMNTELLLNNLKHNLEQNKDVYESGIYAEKGFMSTIRQHDEMLNRNYGVKLL